MATDKRERQRANRAVKQQAESKVARNQRIIALTKRFVWWAVALIVLIIAANVVWG